MSRHDLPQQRLKLFLGLIMLLGIIQFVPHDPIIMKFAILIVFWVLFFWPFEKIEIVMWVVITVFIFYQDYAALSVGAFAFAPEYRDILLMPIYEPFMWGFYYLFLKRFIADPALPQRLNFKAFVGLIMLSLCFAFFGKNSALMNYAMTFATLFLLIMFHERYDFYFVFTALGLGIVIENFGVHTGRWSYPHPDFLQLPVWILIMWMAAGLLGRRFLIPLSFTILRKLQRPTANK